MNSLCHKYLNQNTLPFVGRASELAQLQNDFELYMKEGESRYTLINAPIGYGKTRLIDELESNVAELYGESVVVVHVRYLEGNAASLTPIFTAFFSAFDHHDAVRDVLRRSGLVDDESLTFQNRDALRMQFLLDALHEVGRRFPLMIILEDLQNATDLAALDQFLLALNNVPKYCLISERAESSSTSSQGEQLLRDVALREESPWREIRLSPLGIPVLDSMLETLFELKPSQNLLETTYERSEGSPLKLRTLVRQLVVDGRLCYEDNAWLEDLGVESSAPMSGESEFQKELQRLTTEEILLTAAAAFIGEQFDLRLAKAVAFPYAPSAVADRAIEMLVYKSILRRSIPSVPVGSASSQLPQTETEPHCYEFVHHFFWKTVREDPAFQLPEFATLPISLPLLARELNLPLYTTGFVRVPVENAIFQQIAQEQMSVGVVRLATMEAFLRWSVETAQNLRMSEPAQSRQLLLDLTQLRRQIVWQLASALSADALNDLLQLYCLAFEAAMRSGETHQAKTELDQAEALGAIVRAHPDNYPDEYKARFEGRVAAHRATLAMAKAETKEFRRWAQKARDALAWLDREDLERASLLTSLARSEVEWLLAEGRFDEADALIEGQITDARVLIANRFDEYGLFIRIAVMSKLKQDRNEEGSRLIDQILAEAVKRGNSLIETAFLYPAATAAFYSGDLVLAKKYIEQGLENSRKYGIRFTEIMCTLWKMIIASIEDEHELVSETSKELDDLLAHAAGQLTRISLLEGRASTMNYLRRHARALELSEEAITIAAIQEVPTFTAWAQNEKGLALAGLGRFAEAIATAEDCLALSTDPRMIRRTYAILAGSYSGQKENTKAEEALLRGLELTTENSPDRYLLKLIQARYLRSRITGVSRLRGTKASKFESELVACAAELLAIADRWKAPNIERALREELHHWMPAPRSSAKDSAVQPLILRSFGSLSSSLSKPEDENQVRDNKVRQLLGIMVVAKAEATQLTRERLIAELWPTLDTSYAIRSLHTSVTRARQLMGDPGSIIYTEGEYDFAPHVQIDLLELLACNEAARKLRRKFASFASAHHLERIMEITEQGVFLEGIYGMWIEQIRSRLSTIKRDAALRLIQIDLERGLFDRVERWTAALLRDDEFDEEAVRALLMLNARRKRTAQALSIYESYAKRFKKEFRSEPNPELRALLERVQRGERI